MQSGKTALHLAVEAGNLECVQVLLDLCPATLLAPVRSPLAHARSPVWVGPFGCILPSATAR